MKEALISMGYSVRHVSSPTEFFSQWVFLHVAWIDEELVVVQQFLVVQLVTSCTHNYARIHQLAGFCHCRGNFTVHRQQKPTPGLARPRF